MTNLIPPEVMTFVPKCWGWERWVWNDDKYCGKILFFLKGKSCSWHYHKVKDEVLYLESGLLLVKYSSGDSLEEAEEVVLKPGNAFHVQSGLRHQMVGLEESRLFEFSTHHDDLDSIKFGNGKPMPVEA